MATNLAPLPLARFRTELYQSVLGLRRDALCDLLDAVLTGDGPISLVRHSLSPVFRRGWSSACDALADGSLDVAALRRLFATTMPPATIAGRRLWVLDGTIWPRPAAKTSPARTWGRGTGSGLPESGIVGAWEYQWLVAVPEASGSWVLPLEVGRRDLAAGTATTLAIRQVRAAQAGRPADAPRPLLLLDSHYDVGDLVGATLGVDILARLASNRRFYRPPGPYAGKGAPRKHGPVFQCANPATHGTPNRTQTDPDATYGQVTIAVWHPPAHPAGADGGPDGHPPHPGALAAAGGAAPTAVAGLAWRGAAGGPAHRLALVSAALRGGARLPLPQAGAGLDDDPAPLAAACRPLELVAGRGTVAVVAGARVGGPGAAALGAPAGARRAQSGAGAPGHGPTSAQVGHPGAPTPRARKSTRPAT